MALSLGSISLQAAQNQPTNAPVAEEEEYYSSWSLFLVCLLLIISLGTSYYLQIRRIRAIHETLVSILAGMFVGLVVRLAPGTMIREMLVSVSWTCLIQAGVRCGSERLLLCALRGPWTSVARQTGLACILHCADAAIDRRSSILYFSICSSLQSS